MKQNCPHCNANNSFFSKCGQFTRTSDKRIFQRYKCKNCLKTFSKTTFHKCYRQKKRNLNSTIAELFCSGVSGRRIAKILKISRTTVSRKLKFLGKIAALKNKDVFLKSNEIFEFQFDDLETFEHTKLNHYL